MSGKMTQGTIGASARAPVYQEPLHHATAYVGLDATKERFINYFLSDNVADDVEINAAHLYVDGLGGGLVHLSRDFFWLAAPIAMNAVAMILEGQGAAVGPTIRGTIFLTNVDINLLEITVREVIVRNITFRPERQAWTSSCVYINDPTVLIRDVTLQGLRFFRGTTKDVGGNGITLSSTGGLGIMFTLIHDCHIMSYKFTIGIYIYSANASSFCNGNLVSDTFINQVVYGVKIDNDGTGKTNRNTFATVFVQAHADMLNAFWIANGDNNEFRGCRVWDLPGGRDEYRIDAGANDTRIWGGGILRNILDNGVTSQWRDVDGIADYPPLSVCLFTWNALVAIPTASTVYLAQDGATMVGDNLRFPVPRVGVLRNLKIRLNSNTLTSNVVFTVFVNGAPTALTVTLAAGVLVGEDIVNTVAVAIGPPADVVSLQVVTGATGVSITFPAVTVQQTED